MNWGSVPDWLAGSGALLAVVFAGIAAKAALRTNDQQSRQLAHLEQAAVDSRAEQRRLQASQVAVWIELSAPDSGDARIQVCYSNASTQPVYSVRIKSRFLADTLENSIRFAVMPPTQGVEVSEKSSRILSSKLYVAAMESHPRPGNDDESSRYNSAVQHTLAQLMRQARDDGIQIEFHDAAGISWCRNNRGVLTEIVSSEPPATRS